MGNPDMGGYQPPEAEQSELATQINERANNASEKIQKRVADVIIPTLNQAGTYGTRWLNGMKNDFYILVENPDDESGGGNYQGWTGDEIRELFSVLYGEEMD